METKKWYQSKTLWVNIISLALELTQAFTGLNWIPAGTLTIITNFLNIALRFVTSKPLTVDGEPVASDLK